MEGTTGVGETLGEGNPGTPLLPVSSDPRCPDPDILGGRVRGSVPRSRRDVPGTPGTPPGTQTGRLTEASSTTLTYEERD